MYMYVCPGYLTLDKQAVVVYKDDMSVNTPSALLLLLLLCSAVLLRKHIQFGSVSWPRQMI